MSDAVKDYLAAIGRRGGAAGRGKDKARKGTGAALRKYWAAVKAGKIKRRKRRPNNKPHRQEPAAGSQYGAGAGSALNHPSEESK